jgi:hypothetical protein
MFGALHTFRKVQGLEPRAEVYIPPEGCTARDIAGDLALPVEKIEAVFVNHVVHGLDHLIQAGDRVAFIPTGIPGPARLQLGIFSEGRQFSRS